jgi:hypothetical protein
MWIWLKFTPVSFLSVIYRSDSSSWIYHMFKGCAYAFTSSAIYYYTSVDSTYTTPAVAWWSHRKWWQRFWPKIWQHCKWSKMFKIMWNVLVNVTIRWGAYVQKPLVGGKQTMHVLNHGFIVLMWHTEWTWNKEYNTNNLYKLLITFRVIPKVVYSSLPTMAKVVNAISYFHVWMPLHFMDFHF